MQMLRRDTYSANAENRNEFQNRKEITIVRIAALPIKEAIAGMVYTANTRSHIVPLPVLLAR